MEFDGDVTGASAASLERWKAVLDKVVPCCLVLKVTQTRAMDTEAACSSYATGFVVDKQRGIILTNRHVVTPGPMIAEAIFLNREELPVYPLYYDPIHDFAFLRFDPKALQFMEVAEVPLAPEGASVGLDIRVVGNDSGEKVSILAGTLARLDRDAPSYGRKTYNDFNTFYFQAASGTKGGSSGSPVLDITGRAVALNAGGRNKAASAYYLPLERVVRALAAIQASCDAHEGWSQWSASCLPRGDLQATFVFKGFDEVRRLGLDAVTERLVRGAPVRTHGAAGSASSVTGMLVVESIVPKSAAASALEPGDVLVSVNGTITTHFLTLEEILDESMGKEVELMVERGGNMITTRLPVTDLHSVTPSSLLDVCGGSVHALSYQQARNNQAAVGQVYVAEAGYMLSRASVPRHAIITAVAGCPTPDLATFAAVLKALPHGARVPLEYFTFSERNRMKSTIMHMDRQWYGPAHYWTRDDAAGLWHKHEDWPGLTVDLPHKARALPVPPPSAAVVEAMLNKVEADADERLRCSLVWVEVEIPAVALVDGVCSKSFHGTGVVVYVGEQLGLVLVDRNTVPTCACDVNLGFGAHPAEVPGTVRFLHPLHNFALVSFDISQLPAEARRVIHAVEVLCDPHLLRGDVVKLAGITKSLRMMQRSSVVTNASSALALATPDVPRFRAVHEEVVKLDQDFGNSFSGILTDQQGRMRALYGSYLDQRDGHDREWCAGLPAHVFMPWVWQLVKLDSNPGWTPPHIRTLDAELEPLSLTRAAVFGLPSCWVSRLERLDPERRQVLQVRQCTAESDAHRVLRGGDMLLAVAGKPVTCFKDVEDLLQATLSELATGPPPSPTCSKPAALPATPTKKQRCCADQDAAHSIAPASPCMQPSPTKASHSKSCVPLTLFRQREIVNVTLCPGSEDGVGTDRIIHWCGAQIQAPHRAVRDMGFLPAAGSGVYISRWHHGSPAHRYGLYALHWITEVNGMATPDHDSFIKAVSTLADASFVRVKLLHLETAQPKVLTLKTDLKYWPTWELALDHAAGSWSRSVISSC